MENIAEWALLTAALMSPVLLFLVLQSRFHVIALISAAFAIAAGWCLNLAWAYVASRHATEQDGDILSIAAMFGWACPAALVLLTWLITRFVNRRRA